MLGMFSPFQNTSKFMISAIKSQFWIFSIWLYLCMTPLLEALWNACLPGGRPGFDSRMMQTFKNRAFYFDSSLDSTHTLFENIKNVTEFPWAYNSVISSLTVLRIEIGVSPLSFLFSSKGQIGENKI